MGRSVSYPRNTFVKVYKDISWMGYDVDEETGKSIGDYDPDIGRINFEDEIHYYTDELCRRYKSLYECDKWLDREDHAFLQNNHCFIGVSTYMDLACYWLVSKSVYEPDYLDNPQLADSWCSQICNGFQEIIKPDLHFLGRFSNGEVIYTRA